MSEELKPCPFCGKQSAVIAVRPCLGKLIEYPLCENCNAECETAEQWNTRPIEDDLRADLATLTAERDAARAEGERIMRNAIGDQLTENMNELALKAWGL